MRATGIPASITIAQAILESGWGRTDLARKANNYFGIKDTDFCEGYMEFTTAEFEWERATVEAVQQALTDRGFPCGGADGIFGAHTLAALKMFRAAKNLPGGDQLLATDVAALGIHASQQKIEEIARFELYPSIELSFQHHARLISAAKRYAPAMAVASDPDKFAHALQACGYSTNPAYGDELMELVRLYDLTKFDKQPEPPAQAKEQVA